MKSLVRPAYLRQGMTGDDHKPRENESHLDSLLRVNLAYMACTYEVQECCQKAKDVFKAWRETEDPDNMDTNP